jgi:hypothetical protein
MIIFIFFINELGLPLGCIFAFTIMSFFCTRFLWSNFYFFLFFIQYMWRWTTSLSKILYCFFIVVSNFFFPFSHFLVKLLLFLNDS